MLSRRFSFSLFVFVAFLFIAGVTVSNYQTPNEVEAQASCYNPADLMGPQGFVVFENFNNFGFLFSEGRGIVGGDFTNHSGSTLQKGNLLFVEDIAENDAALVVGGQFTAHDGWMTNGDLYTTQKPVYTGSFAVVKDTNIGTIPYATNSYFTQLGSLSTLLAGLPENNLGQGVNLNNSIGTYDLVYGPGFNVFNTPDSLYSQRVHLQPPNLTTYIGDASSVINVPTVNSVLSSNVNMTLFNSSSETLGKNQVFNLHQATTVNIEPDFFRGSIIMPNADLIFDSAGATYIYGTLIAKSITIGPESSVFINREADGLPGGNDQTKPSQYKPYELDYCFPVEISEVPPTSNPTPFPTPSPTPLISPDPTPPAGVTPTPEPTPPPGVVITPTPIPTVVPTPLPSPSPSAFCENADMNSDGIINGQDVATVAQYINQGGAYDPAYDFNGDGILTTDDLTYYAQNHASCNQ